MKETQQRADFAKPRIEEEGLTWPEIFEAYKKTKAGKADKKVTVSSLRDAYRHTFPPT